MQQSDERGAAASRGPFVMASAEVVGIAERLAASGEPWFWFDGAAAPAGESRTSYLGTASAVRIAERGREREFLDGLRAETEVGAGAGRGFRSGWVVALSYEFGVSLMGLHPSPDDGAPAFALRVDAVLAVDHDSGVAEVHGADAAAWAARFPAPAAAPQPAPAPIPNPGEGQRPVPTSWRRDDVRYAEEIEACRAAIGDGDAYVLCLTDTAAARGEFDPLRTYLRLRRSGPAARGAVVVAHDRSLVSASPERFLGLHDGALETHPIKGTRPRGANAAEDAVLAADLAADPKERAENLMIVDLMRNDFSRVCAAGTVGVADFLRVETHPHVHQLVSTVSGRLLPGLGIADAIAACFPGGSMTGAPKRSAVQILQQLEERPRGLYSGCFGWIDDRGDAELAMTIRGIELREPLRNGVSSARRFAAALVGAGGGITADSDPPREVAEKHLKAAAIFSALGPR